MNTLLVVEDEKLIRQGIVAMIRRSSVPVEEILECRNGEEALEILRNRGWTSCSLISVCPKWTV